jgi:hypothetical protein
MRSGALFLCLLLCSCSPEPAPAEELFLRTWFIDPLAGDDANDGLSEATPKRSFDGLPSSSVAQTRVALKRGTVTRLKNRLKLRGGNAKGWASWGAYGDASLPKPIVVGSLAVSAADWSAPDSLGLRSLSWEAGSGDGVERGPGNLWFFDAERLTGWGWRKQSRDLVLVEGDWFYEPSTHVVWLRWAGTPPPLTEVSLNLMPALDFSGQSDLIIEDWDLRYLGGYALRGHASTHLRVRRVDVSYVGGGTKTGEYVRLGNGFETNGDVDDVVVEDCRFHEIFDTAFDPQNTGGASTQRHLTYRRNLISRMGLAGVELWMRPRGTVLEDVAVTDNVFMETGFGWGFEQHDHPGTAKVGAEVFISTNEAQTARISLTGNTFHHPRAMLAADFQQSRALVNGLTLDDNRWSGVGAPAVVLFAGALETSPTFATLADWQANTLVPGKDAHSVEAEVTGLPHVRPVVTRFGPFALDP